MNHVRRIQLALLAVLGVVVAGSIGYLVLGFSLLDAVYQTVTTITTVGFREVRPLGAAGKIFTITPRLHSSRPSEPTCWNVTSAAWPA